MNSTDTVIYSHVAQVVGVAVATNGTGGVVSRQEFTPFGDVRPAIGDVNQTSLDYTVQRRDGAGRLSSNVRYYDPGTANFLSPDSIVPGLMAGAALPCTAETQPWVARQAGWARRARPTTRPPTSRPRPITSVMPTKGATGCQP